MANPIPIYPIDTTQLPTAQSATPGLIGSTNTATVANATAPTLAPVGAATAVNAAPTNWNIDSNQTVSGRIGSIIAGGSPLLQQAQGRANQQSNARGLVNSSMGVQAGESALYGAALPIAQGDASAYQQSGQFNAAAANAASAQNAQLGTQTALANTAAANQFKEQQAQLAQQAALQNAQSGTQVSLANTEAANRAKEQQAQLAQQANLQNATQANQVALANSEQVQKARLTEADQYFKNLIATGDNTMKQYMADLEANYKSLMQSDASVASMMTQYLKSMSEVQTSANLDATGKATAITNMQTAIRDALTLQDGVTGLNLADLLLPTGA